MSISGKYLTTMRWILLHLAFPDRLLVLLDGFLHSRVWLLLYRDRRRPSDSVYRKHLLQFHFAGPSQNFHSFRLRSRSTYSLCERPAPENFCPFSVRLHWHTDEALFRLPAVFVLRFLRFLTYKSEIHSDYPILPEVLNEKKWIEQETVSGHTPKAVLYFSWSDHKHPDRLTSFLFLSLYCRLHALFCLLKNIRHEFFRQGSFLCNPDTFHLPVHTSYSL